MYKTEYLKKNLFENHKMAASQPCEYKWFATILMPNSKKKKKKIRKG